MTTAINPHAAAREGDFSVLKLYVERGGSTNVSDDDSFTPIHYATNFGHVHCVQFLIESGADVNSRSKFGSVPLHFAAEHGRLDIIELLLACKADVNASNSDLATPLHFSAQRGFCRASSFLLDNGAAIDAKTKKGNTPLHYAAFYGHVKVVAMLLERGADVSVLNAWSKLAGIDFFRKVSDETRQAIRCLLRKQLEMERGHSISSHNTLTAKNSPLTIRRSKPKATYSPIVGPTVFSSVEELQNEVVKLKETIATLELELEVKDDEICSLAKYISHLESQMKQMGIEINYDAADDR